MLNELAEACPEGTRTAAACIPWSCAPGRICAAHAPRISPADAAPLAAIFRDARSSLVLEAAA